MTASGRRPGRPAAGTSTPQAYQSFYSPAARLSCALLLPPPFDLFLPYASTRPRCFIGLPTCKQATKHHHNPPLGAARELRRNGAPLHPPSYFLSSALYRQQQGEIGCSDSFVKSHPSLIHPYVTIIYFNQKWRPSSRLPTSPTRWRPQRNWKPPQASWMECPRISKTRSVSSPHDSFRPLPSSYGFRKNWVHKASSLCTDFTSDPMGAACLNMTQWFVGEPRVVPASRPRFTKAT